MKRFIFIMTVLIGGCVNEENSLETVKNVDIKRYMGLWYEIARLPNSFEEGLTNVTAQYSLNADGTVRVYNKGFKEAENNKLDEAEGKAYAVDSSNSKLKVTFFWPFYGDYWIIFLAGDYSYAVVGSPSRSYLWILSRTPTMEKSTYDDLLQAVKDKGFDITKLETVMHSR
jgi:apolipoprotein D and lipocalin family protein